PPRAGGAAPAVGGRRRRARPLAAATALSGPVYPGGGRQPVSVRLLRRPAPGVSLPAAPGGRLPAPTFGALGRPDRPARGADDAQLGRALGPGRVAYVRGGARPGAGGQGDPGPAFPGPGHSYQRPHGRCPRAPLLPARRADRDVAAHGGRTLALEREGAGAGAESSPDHRGLGRQRAYPAAASAGGAGLPPGAGRRIRRAGRSYPFLDGGRWRTMSSVQRALTASLLAAALSLLAAAALGAQETGTETEVNYCGDTPVLRLMNPPVESNVVWELKRRLGELGFDAGDPEDETY